MSPSTRIALASFAAFAVLVVALPLVLPIDEAVYRAIQANRDCKTRDWGIALGRITAALLALGGASLLVGGVQSRRAVLTAIVTVAGGALIGELLKTMIERVRPDGMPGTLTGNALPSGHVMNTTLIAAAFWRLGDGSSLLRLLVGGVLSAAVLSQCASRLLLEAHWMSDVIASMLLGLSWTAASPALLHIGFWKGLTTGALGAALVGLLLTQPGFRLHLPSMLVTPPPFAVNLDFEDPEAQKAARGDWMFGAREPIGAVAWLRSPDGTLTLDATDRAPSWLRIGLRPTTRDADRQPACLRLQLELNDWRSQSFALARGWRELRLTPPASAWRSQGNLLRFRIDVEAETAAARSDFGLLGLRYVRAGGDPPGSRLAQQNNLR